MKARRRPRRAFAVAGAALALVLPGCEARERAAATAPPSALGETTDPLPPLPPWAGGFLGRQLREAFPADGACVGNADRVDRRYRGVAPGTRVMGWAWDTALKQPVERILLVDAGLQIVGAGEAGQPRPDVPAARPDVTDPGVGWSALTPLAAGPVDAYGIVGDGGAVCRLGQVVL